MAPLSARIRSWWEGSSGDLRFSLRALARHPGFTLVAILTLALGIGATAAIWTVVQAVLLSALPYPQPERLVFIWVPNRVRIRFSPRPATGSSSAN